LPTPIALIATFAALNIFPHGTAFNAVEMHAPTSLLRRRPLRARPRDRLLTRVGASMNSGLTSAVARNSAERCDQRSGQESGPATFVTPQSILSVSHHSSGVTPSSS
jgi:hypothetical protein